MLNMLIAMMAKTFDRIHSETAVNFNFLRGRVITTWLTQHPSPPPFNLLTMIFHAVQLLIITPLRICKVIKKTGHRGDHLDDEAKLLSISAASRQASSVGPQSTSSRRLKSPLKMMSERSATITCSYAYAEASKRSQMLTYSDAAHRAFRLIADFRDEKHLRALAKQLALDIKDKMGENHPEAEMRARLNRMEVTLESLSDRADEIFSSLQARRYPNPTASPLGAIRGPPPSPTAALQESAVGGNGVNREGADAAESSGPERPSGNDGFAGPLEPAQTPETRNTPPESPSSPEQRLWEEPKPLQHRGHRSGGDRERVRRRRSGSRASSTASSEIASSAPATSQPPSATPKVRRHTRGGSSSTPSSTQEAVLQI